VTQSAWRLFAVAATAAVIFGTAGWILALFGGRNAVEEEGADEIEPGVDAAQLASPGEEHEPTRQ
jgi:membrane protein YqaA with SNARE-associated domain